MLLLIPIIVAALLLPIFANFFGAFKLVLRKSGFLRPGFLFLGPGIFYLSALSMRLNGCGVIALGIVLIGLKGVKTRLENSLYLGVDHFFDYFIKVIELPAAFFHFYSHRGF